MLHLAAKNVIMLGGGERLGILRSGRRFAQRNRFFGARLFLFSVESKPTDDDVENRGKKQTEKSHPEHPEENGCA